MPQVGTHRSLNHAPKVNVQGPRELYFDELLYIGYLIIFGFGEALSVIIFLIQAFVFFNARE